MTSDGEQIRRQELAESVIKYRLRKFAEEWELLFSLSGRHPLSKEQLETLNRIRDEIGEVNG